MSPAPIHRVVVTSGPTREFFDPIRYFSNPSTGKMGYFIACSAVKLGYKVSFISGPVLPPYDQVEKAKNISVVSTQDMLEAVLKEIGSNSILIMAAAPADFKPEKIFRKKLKKQRTKTLKLLRNKDILKEAWQTAQKKKFKGLILVGFAGETHKAKENARKKLRSKNLDIIFLNDLSKKHSGFGVDTNQLRVFRKDGTSQKWPLLSKKHLGEKIMTEIGAWVDR